MKIGLLGCGNMGSAIARAWNRSRSDTFFLFDPNDQKRETLAQALTCAERGSGLDQLALCEIVILAIKPQMLSEVAREIRPHLHPKVEIVSILAGTRMERLLPLSSAKTVVRVMPNTPLLVEQGVSLLYFSQAMSPARREFFKQQFSAFSLVYEARDEGEIDALTGVTGSGPAYIFDLAAIMMEYLESVGVAPRQADELVRQTILGSAVLLKNSSDVPSVLRANVTSKGGTTEAALESLNWRERILQALDKARQRSIELGK